MMERRVEPEWLDGLTSDDPLSHASRKDLQLINRLMGNAPQVARLCTLLTAESTDQVIELGGGDGTFMLQVAARWPRSDRSRKAILVDRSPFVQAETRAALARLNWHLEVLTADVFTWIKDFEAAKSNIVFANLFLHHFEKDRLTELFHALTENCRLFVACEPRRSTFALFGSRLLGVLGCNPVTRHDAPISVVAGFADKELSALWPKNGTWQTGEGRAGLFTHCFWARNELKRCT